MLHETCCEQNRKALTSLISVTLPISAVNVVSGSQFHQRNRVSAGILSIICTFKRPGGTGGKVW